MQTVSVKQIAVGPMENFSYLVVDSKQKKAAYVDPGWEVSKVFQCAKDLGVRIEAVLITHTHPDHCHSLPDVEELAHVPVYVHSLEVEYLPNTKLPIHLVEEGTEIEVGSLKIRCLHTPGHTPGEICYQIEEHLLTGDVLFVDGCGRVDLPGSDPEKMFQTLRRLGEFPDDVVIYPGHDYGPKPTDTMGNQKESNPFLSSAIKGKDFFFGVRGVP